MMTNMDDRGTPIWRRMAIAVAVLNLVVASALVLHVGAGSTAGFLLAADGSRDPVPLLGTKLDTTDCITATRSVGKGFVAFCPDFSAVASPGGIAEVISLYSAGNTVIGEYTGPLPLGLHWGDALKDVAARLGEPRRISDMYGPPTLIYMFEGKQYGSLELQFDRHDRLFRINAGLTH
jgi:hypothetical protein